MADDRALEPDAAQTLDALLLRLYALARREPWTAARVATTYWPHLPPVAQRALADIIDRTLLT